MWSSRRAVFGSLLGALVVLVVAPHCIGWFSVPTGGIGAVTVAKYPKGFDYFVVLALTIGSAIGAFLLHGRARETGEEQQATKRRVATLATVAIVFVTMFLVHDHPYAFMDMFHEGEHLSPASVLRDGGRPYGDIFFLHGFAADGGLDALVFGSKPSAKKTRRMETLLDAAALALLVPIAAEITATTAGLVLAVVLGLCAIGAGEVPAFPYFRWLPLLIAVWALLVFWRKAQSGRRAIGLLVIATTASSLGILWSLDVGVCALASTVIVVGCMHVGTRPRPPVSELAILVVCAIAAPLLVLLISRADLHHFVRDSFVIIPRSIDAIWSLPAKPPAWSWESARYYVPPVFFGLLLALAVRRRDIRMATIATFSIVLFRTAAGRCSWSHTRFGLPLLGIAVVAFLIEPLLRRPFSVSRIVTLLLFVIAGFQYFELADNAKLGAPMLAGWPARQHHEQLVPYPLARGRGIFTYPENAGDLSALDEIARRAGPGPMFDLSGERALYFLLDRRPATRCPDVAMLSNRELSAEALSELTAHPPVFVVLEGTAILGSLDGIANRDRVPLIASWVDAHYPVRARAGRFLVALQR